MVPITADEGRGIRLRVGRILAVCRASGVLQKAIHLHQGGHGTAIRLGEEGDRRGVGLML